MEPTSKIKDQLVSDDASAKLASQEFSSASGKDRTMGNKVFDLLVYPTIAFGAVFAFSVAMLHTTKFGTGPMRKKYENWVTSVAKKFEGSSYFKGKTTAEVHKAADNYISVGVSFAAGTLLIAPIKIFEDHRGKIAKKIDQFLGTVPADPEHYASEPKQSWTSVLGGRALTFATVFGLATVAGKHINQTTENIAGSFSKSWGKRWPGTKPATIKKVKEWSYVTVFEGFYTAVCAGLLYVISRTLARGLNKEENPYLDEKKTQAPASGNVDTAEPATKTFTESVAPRKTEYVAQRQVETTQEPVHSRV